MTKNKIIAQIVKDGKFLKICQNITHNSELYKDLFQECILILLEKDEDLICELHLKDELRAYFIRIVQNSFNSSTSPFYKKYRKQLEVKKEDSSEDIESQYDYERIVEYINESSNSRLEWFDNQTVKLLIQGNEITMLSKKTGINFRTLKKAIERFKQRINGNEEFKRRAV